MMAKLSQKKQMHADAVLVSGTITNFIMNNMVESMVRANVSYDDIFKAITQTKKRIQMLERFAPNDLSKDMVDESTTWFDYYGQTWLDECRAEIEAENEAA